MSDPGPPFFIVGSARSGTTLLRLMLNAHPEVAVPPESRFAVELWHGNEDVDVNGFLEELAVHRQFTAWELPIEDVRAEIGDRVAIRYADAVGATYRAHAHSKGKVRWGDKTPRFVEHIPFLDRLFPDALFLHLLRDGRDVALSYADVPFGPKRVAPAAELWARRVRRGIEDGRRLPAGRYLEMRYEDFVEDPVGEAKDLCEFLGLPFDEAMLEYRDKAMDAVLPRAERYNPNVTQGISRKRKWEEKMPAAQVEVFEAVAGDVLSELGYERRHTPVGALARARARLGLLGLPLDRLKPSR